MARLSLLRQQDAPYILLVSPLLFEAGQVELVQRTLVVDVPEALQIERTTQRDDVDPAQAKAIVASQMAREQRLSLADDVITNDADLAALSDAVKALDATYRSLAAKA